MTVDSDESEPFKIPPTLSTKLRDYLKEEQSNFEQRYIESLQQTSSVVPPLLPPQDPLLSPASTEATSTASAVNRVVQKVQCLVRLGFGAFGNVVLVKSRVDASLFALKVMQKSRLRGESCKRIFNERRISACCKCPFTCQSIFSYKDAANLYLAFEFLPGGEFFLYLCHRREVCRPINEDEATFYAAQIALAIVYLHNVDVVHRDIKPENVLIDGRGYLQLADFGFAKRLKAHDRTYTFCGTEEYLAPEVIAHQAYGRVVDWWAFGVFIYEICTGQTPFAVDENLRLSGEAKKKALHENVQQSMVRFPASLKNVDLRSLISNLLQKDLSRRYGNLQNGAEDVLGSKWFSSIDWDALFEKRLPAPWVPKAKSFGENFVPNPKMAEKFLNDLDFSKPTSQELVDEYAGF